MKQITCTISLFVTLLAGCNKKDTSTPEPIDIKGKATAFSLRSFANLIQGGGAIVQADNGKLYTVTLNTVDAGNGNATMVASSSPFISASSTATMSSTLIYYAGFGSNTITITPTSLNSGNVPVKSLQFTVSSTETTMAYQPDPVVNTTATQFNQMFQNLITHDIRLIVNNR